MAHLTQARESPGSEVTAELVHRVRAIVAAMEPAVREVFLLHCVAERGYIEIAEWLRMSISDVEDRLADAVVALSLGLQQEGKGPQTPAEP